MSRGESRALVTTAIMTDVSMITCDNCHKQCFDRHRSPYLYDSPGDVSVGEYSDCCGWLTLNTHGVSKCGSGAVKAYDFCSYKCLVTWVPLP